jgi:hypothetical protein
MPKSVRVNAWHTGSLAGFFANIDPSAVSKWLAKVPPPETDKNVVVGQRGRAFYSDVVRKCGESLVT